MTIPTKPPIPTHLTGATLVPAADLRRVLDRLSAMANDARREAERILNEAVPGDEPGVAHAEAVAYGDGLDLAINLLSKAMHDAALFTGTLARSGFTDDELRARARNFAGNPSDGAEAAAALVLRMQHAQEDYR